MAVALRGSPPCLPFHPQGSILPISSAIYAIVIFESSAERAVLSWKKPPSMKPKNNITENTVRTFLAISENLLLSLAQSVDSVNNLIQFPILKNKYRNQEN